MKLDPATSSKWVKRSPLWKLTKYQATLYYTTRHYTTRPGPPPKPRVRI